MFVEKRDSSISLNDGTRGTLKVLDPLINLHYIITRASAGEQLLYFKPANSPGNISEASSSPCPLFQHLGPVRLGLKSALLSRFLCWFLKWFCLGRQRLLKPLWGGWGNKEPIKRSVPFCCRLHEMRLCCAWLMTLESHHWGFRESSTTPTSWRSQTAVMLPWTFPLWHRMP